MYFINRVFLLVSFCIVLSSCSFFSRSGDRKLDKKLDYDFYKLKANGFLHEGKPDSAANILENLRFKAIENEDHLTLAKAALALGKIKLDQGKIYLAEKYLLEAVNLYETLHLNYSRGEAYTQYGRLLAEKGTNKEAQKYLIDAYKIFEQFDSLESVSQVCLSIGNLFADIGSSDEAMKYYRIAETTASKVSNISNQVAALQDMGILIRQNNPDSALYYYGKAESLQPTGTNKIMRIIRQFNVANVYLDKKDFTKARALYDEVLQFCKTENIYAGISRTYSGIALIYSKMGKYDLAVSYFNRAIHIADSLGESTLSLSLKSQMVKVYVSSGQYKELYLLQQKINLVKDSVMTAQKNIAVHELGILYETEKKEAENVRLKTGLENQRKNLMIRLVFIVVLTISLILLLFVYRNNNKIKRQQINELQEKNRYESELKQIKVEQADFLQKIVDHQKEEIMMISKSNEIIRVQLAEKQIVEPLNGHLPYDPSSKNLLASPHYWEKLMLKINLIYPGFLEKLQKQFPTLSQSEIQFCILIKLNFTMKDISAIFSINTQSLYKKKYRLSEKMGLDDNQVDIYKTIQQLV
jgi:tetratricopeptide (TPR) repeat protein